MTSAKQVVATAAAALVFAACAGNALANNADAAHAAAKTASVPPAKDALFAREKSAYEAWKSKDAKFWDAFLADKFVGYGSSGKLDKASAQKQYAGADCEIARYALSDEHARPLGKGVVLLTYKVAVDGSCGGKKVPATNRAASIYVREHDAWRAAFHAEAPIVDPKDAAAARVARKEAPAKNEATQAAADAGTAALIAAEKAVWEAWKDHDGKKIAALTATDLSFINIFGTYLANKADALQDWTGNGCEVSSVSVTDGVGTMLSPTVGILTFNGAADGTCFGQKIGPIRGTSVYVRQGGAWKWTFGINLPAGP